MFQSPLNIKHKSGHLFTLHSQLFLEEVNADGFLVALGEGSPAVPLDHARLPHSSIAHYQDLNTNTISDSVSS